MSQAKVEQYKKEKANRKQIMAKERMQKRIRQAIAAVVCVAVVGWAGYSFYGIYESNQPVHTYYCDTSALDDYMSEISN